ncbi:MAG: DUF6152 family protein [Bryobacteraceae bacterium]
MTANRSYRSQGRGLVTAALGLGVLLCGTVAWAHHAIAGKFDVAKPIELTGVVTSVDWRNPHAHLFMNVKTPGQGKAKGTQILNWAVELESPSLLEMDGWNRDTVRVGNTITVKGGRARDNSRQIWGDQVRLVATGAMLFTPKVEVSKAMGPARATPRWPDGKPALGGIPGMEDGIWTNPSKSVLVENGVDVKMDAYGQLANLADVAKVAPMQPWALGVYRSRQERMLKDDPMFVNCKPPGGPRQYQSRLGVQFIEDKVRNRVFVLMGSGNHNYHIFYLGGREKGLVTGDDDNPLYFGRSAAKWEGDTLVVDSRGFNEDFWFTEGGLPHTSDLHLTERFTRTNLDTLRYEVTVDDPGAYTRTWSASWTMQWKGGATLPSHFCQNNRQ